MVNLLEDSTNSNLSLTKVYEDEMSNSARYKKQSSKLLFYYIFL